MNRLRLIWQLLKPVLKILLAGALGGIAARLPEALGAAQNEAVTTGLPALAVAIAYILKQPFQPKP